MKLAACIPPSKLLFFSNEVCRIAEENITYREALKLADSQGYVKIKGFGKIHVNNFKGGVKGEVNKKPNDK